MLEGFAAAQTKHLRSNRFKNFKSSRVREFESLKIQDSLERSAFFLAPRRMYDEEVSPH